MIQRANSRKNHEKTLKSVNFSHLSHLGHKLKTH